jgi:hypothetical protein
MRMDNLDWGLILVGLNSNENPMYISNATAVYKWKAVIEGVVDVKYIFIVCLDETQFTQDAIIEKIERYYGGSLLELLDENDNSLWSK